MMMIAPAPAPSAFDTGAWKAWIAQRARLEMPALLRSSTRRLPPVATTNIITKPLIQPETGAMRRLDTEMISAINLLTVDVHGTKELVSAAVQWFYQHHHYLPAIIVLNPIRTLAIDRPDFFAVDCMTTCMVDGEEIAVDLSYTVVVKSGNVGSDEVQLSCAWCTESYTPGGQG